MSMEVKIHKNLENMNWMSTGNQEEKNRNPRASEAANLTLKSIAG